MDNALTWFITGCSSGIGLAMATRALQHGHNVVATARRPEALQHLEDEFGRRLLRVRHDVDVPANNEAAVQAAQDRFGAVDVLVNNAGYGLEGAVEELTMEQIRSQMETNVFALIHLTKLCIPQMRERGSGMVVNVASIAGLRGYNGLSIYNASKFAVVGFSEALRQELRPFGIKVACVEPGPYRTEWAGRSLQRSETMNARDANSPYARLNDTLLRSIDGASGTQPGDPNQIADVLLSAAAAPEIPLHFVFGDEAIKVWTDKLERYQDPTYMDFFPHTRWAL
jgi:NAD(P)-dependent dehydrogenase (short-subunit alcohol dehydrogenase family)